MSGNKNINIPPETGQLNISDPNVALQAGDVSSVAGSVQSSKRVSSSSDRQIKFERAQKCLQNAALVSKRIKEHRKATAELLGRPFEDDDGGDTASEMASTVSERTGYSVATDTSTALSVQEALNIPGISESLANTLKQKEILMEKIKQYKEISKRPITTKTKFIQKDSADSTVGAKKIADNKDLNQLINTIKEKENALSVMQVKMKAMETTILDLQEKINEKDQIIESKNKATTIISDSLSKKERDTLALLEDTRQQMTKMQENFAYMEAEWKNERENLLSELKTKDEKINNLEEANTILENARFEISIAHGKLTEEIQEKEQKIIDLQKKIQELSELPSMIIQEPSLTKQDEEKGSREIEDMVELTKKIELLEKLNCQIRQTNKELESKLAATASHSEAKSSTSSPNKKASPLPTRKGGRNTASKMKSPWSNLSTESLQDVEKKSCKGDASKLESVMHSLNKDILEKEYTIFQKEALITELQNDLTEKETTICELRSKLLQIKSVDTLDVGVNTDQDSVQSKLIGEQLSDSNIESCTNIEELHEKLKAAQDQIILLNNEIEVANKNMIKVKSNHKLKLKQMQKTIENFSKVSDANAEIIRLNDELHELTQKVAELEEEKGNLQLHLVDYDSGRLTDSDIYKKMIEMESLAESRLKAISVLETQKFDLVQELHVLQQKNDEMEDKLADMSQLQTDQVCIEMKSVQLEEQIDQLTSSKRDLELVIDNLKVENIKLSDTIKCLKDERDEMTLKLENYVQENVDLHDKLDKLSAEKVSSAESIEIVESLTTQEKLELEEYSKGMIENKIVEHRRGSESCDTSENIDKIVKQSEELKIKIECFNQERQEVLEKMNMITEENKQLQSKIFELTDQCNSLQANIDQLQLEKHDLQVLNEDVAKQVEELKRERLDIMKESIEIRKPSSMEDATEIMSTEAQTDDKLMAEKSNKAVKSVKQLTKEILKLKNTIKEREEEIADCHMKILSLEEQEQKHSDLLQSNVAYEIKIKNLLNENNQLRQELDSVKKESNDNLELAKIQQDNELLQQELQKIHQDYLLAINNRDAKTYELENLLQEYEKQIVSYGSTLQQKDKEISDYINQITKLNDVSQKLKSTIELLEEEKLKDQSAEMVKSLNKQILAYQKKLAEYEDKIRNYEEEKGQLLSMKSALENKYNSIEIELKNAQDVLTEKQNTLKDLQKLQHSHSEEMKIISDQLKERDEEIHEVKLQLRKESIENEKLRVNLSEEKNTKEQLSCQLKEMQATISEKKFSSDQISQEIVELREKVNLLLTEKLEYDQKIEVLEIKNKELLEKLKKFALNIKKRNVMYTELENHYNELQKQLEGKNEQLEQLGIQVETIPALQEKLKYAEEALNDLKLQKLNLEQQISTDILQLHTENDTLHSEKRRLNDELLVVNKELHLSREENSKLTVHIAALNNKLVAYEIEQKNNTNLLTKISNLESDINQKQLHVMDLQNQIESYKQQITQVQFGYDAKCQERDMYIENLESEINKYRIRNNRLEEAISAIEDRRNKLENKADYLDNQLQEKQKAYSEYVVQEDELIRRLAVLMDHDRLVEKQLHEIESENKELHFKIQHLNDENQRLVRNLADAQEQYNLLLDKANRTDAAESEVNCCQSELTELRAQLKKITHDHQSLLSEKKQVLEELESEFNEQIENSIKEKKILSEKYEKMNDHVSLLESKLHEYKLNINNLNVNIEELNNINQQLMTNQKIEQVQPPDYSEQYVAEINKLNSIINSKNEEIAKLQNSVLRLQDNYNAFSAKLDCATNEYSMKSGEFLKQIEDLQLKLNNLSNENNKLLEMLSEKEEQIKHLTDKTKMAFEMNIPKTEGMIISSTIEPLDEDVKEFNVSALESQIISEVNKPDSIHPEVVSDSMQRQGPSSGVLEQLIVPKKAYECFKNDEPISTEMDPFNSDEGWGFGVAEESANLLPGYSNFVSEIEKLKSENEMLRNNINASSVKLQKALKKLKEMKASNDMLSNELKIAKQISQSTLLDSAIEEELASNVKELEQKLEDLRTELNKERRENEVIRKQNEVFNNANDKLTDMKEKLDNEIELWKYRYKEANDKLSSYEWGASSSPDHVPIGNLEPQASPDVNRLREEIIKTEKENDELHTLNEQLTLKNNDLTRQLTKLEEVINNLDSQTVKSSDHDMLQQDLLSLQVQYKDLEHQNETLVEKLNEAEKKYDETVLKYQQLEQEYKNIKKANILDENKHLESDYSAIKAQLDQANNKLFEFVNIEKQNQELMHAIQCSNNEVTRLQDEMASLKSVLKLQPHSTYGENMTQVNTQPEDMKNLLCKLEIENKELLHAVAQKEDKINELNSKVAQLNSENDSLLSTVTELRSSLTSAVDQRGFEIAELWKQHLTQREGDFHKIEQELRTELNLSISKYEQLLDSVQSSSQEETNKLIMETQIDSLQSKLQDREEHLRDIQEKYSELMGQCDMLRSEMEDEKVMYENKLMSQQEEYEKQLKELRESKELDSQNYQQSIENVQKEFYSSKAEKDDLLKQIEDLTQSIEDCEEKILELTNEVRLKDMEINSKTQEYSVALTQRNERFELVRQQLLQYEKQVEDIGFEKESELAVLRLKMHDETEYYERKRKEYESQNEHLTEALNEKIVECTNLNRKISELNKSLEDHSTKLAEMQAALENQELEIVTLKDEITSLQDMLRASSTKIEKHVTFAADTKPGSEAQKEFSNELLDAVPRAELDLAMYMLHQRDVRCEELTMELTRLLEERDTLQLRLSDSLRSYEDLRSKCKSAGMDTSMDASQESVAEMSSFSVEREFVDTHRRHGSRSSSVSDPDGEKPKLQAKLSELRSVRHSRDVTLRHDSEQRQLGLRLLQRDVANLPPEAVEQLAQAHHTLSRDAQSTSTVLLNWLRGKSTPNVVQDM